MKKIIFVLMFISLFLLNCELQDEPIPESNKIIIHYSGDSWLFLTNTTIDNITYAYITEPFGSYELKEVEKEWATKAWDNIKIDIVKTTGTKYQDEGLLIVSLIDENNNILVSDTAELGDLEANIIYNFSPE